MSYHLAAALFQSETRSKVLELLFVRGVRGSVSELARRAALSPRGVANEVHHLRATDLVRVESVGGADVVSANEAHPAAVHLRALLQMSAAPAADAKVSRHVRESLAAWGAPLAGVTRRRRFALEETLLRALDEARHDGTVLRVLPVVVARNLESIGWVELKEDARRKKLQQELGFLVDLTGVMLGRENVSARVRDLHDRRRHKMRFFPEPKNRFEEELAKKRSPRVAERWGFWMNMSEESFRSTLDRHRA